MHKVDVTMDDANVLAFILHATALALDGGQENASVNQLGKL